MSEFESIFTNIGYPIAVTVVLFYYIFTEQRNFRKSIDNNTKVMTKLLSFFEARERGDIDDGD